jgi:hypothetical protein
MSNRVKVTVAHLNSYLNLQREELLNSINLLSITVAQYTKVAQDSPEEALSTIRYLEETVLAEAPAETFETIQRIRRVLTAAAMLLEIELDEDVILVDSLTVTMHERLVETARANPAPTVVDEPVTVQ